MNDMWPEVTHTTNAVNNTANHCTNCGFSSTPFPEPSKKHLKWPEARGELLKDPARFKAYMKETEREAELALLERLKDHSQEILSGTGEPWMAVPLSVIEAEIDRLKKGTS